MWSFKSLSSYQSEPWSPSRTASANSTSDPLPGMCQKLVPCTARTFNPTIPSMAMAKPDGE